MIVILVRKTFAKQWENTWNNSRTVWLIPLSSIKASVSKLENRLQGPEDLVRSSVATIPDSTSADYLLRFGITAHNYATVQSGLQAVADGRVDAMVYDAPLLKYLVKTKFAGEVEVLPVTFERQDYGIALPAGSDLRENINRSLLRVLASPEWRETRRRHLGE